MNFFGVTLFWLLQSLNCMLWLKSDMIFIKRAFGDGMSLSYNLCVKATSSSFKAKRTSMRRKGNDLTNVSTISAEVTLDTLDTLSFLYLSLFSLFSLSVSQPNHSITSVIDLPPKYVFSSAAAAAMTLTLQSSHCNAIEGKNTLSSIKTECSVWKDCLIDQESYK